MLLVHPTNAISRPWSKNLLCLFVFLIKFDHFECILAPGCFCVAPGCFWVHREWIIFDLRFFDLRLFDLRLFHKRLISFFHFFSEIVWEVETEVKLFLCRQERKEESKSHKIWLLTIVILIVIFSDNVFFSSVSITCGLDLNILKHVSVIFVLQNIVRMSSLNRFHNNRSFRSEC